jgi:DNA-3-methyladenine glycosylase II
LGAVDASFVAPGPVDVAATLSRFRLWGEDPVNRLSDGIFRRAFKAGGRWRVYELRWSGEPDATRLTLSVPGARRAAIVDEAIREVRHVCGLDLDLAAFRSAAEGDAVLRDLVPRLHGLRPTLSPSPFEMLVSSVCAQQVNLAFAFTLRARLVRRFGEPLLAGGQAVYAFPEPAVLARAQVADLRRMQLTTRKAEYVVGLAREVATGALDLTTLASRPNEEVVERLTALRGFGRWSAEWFLARCLGRGDVCAAGDLAVRRAFEHFYGRGRALDEAAVRRRAARWRHHQNFAVHYLLAGRRLATAAAAGGGV